MPLPVKVEPRPAPAVTPKQDPRGGTAMAAGPAAVVRARSMTGNAAVAAALGGLPRGAEPDALAGQMLLAGQEIVGNQAVAAKAGTQPAKQAPAKQAPGKPQPKPIRKAKPPPPSTPDKKGGKSVAERADKGKEPPTGPRAPGADPKFLALKKDVAVKKRVVGTSHPPAAAESGAAQEAAVPPADDQEARGKAAHSEDMAEAEPKSFDKATFVAAVEKAIRDRAPKNLDEADKFGESTETQEVAGQVQGQVKEGKDASAKEIADTTAATPQPAGPQTVVPMSPDKLPRKPGAPDANKAAPDPLPPSATDLSAGSAKVEGTMDAAGVTEDQLTFTNAREPAFDKAVKDKQAMDAHATAAPKKLRAAESDELKQTKAKAATLGPAAMGDMHTRRRTGGEQVTEGKGTAKSRTEDKKAKVTALLQKVYDDTKCDVEKILSDVDTTVDRQFTDGEKRARQRFTDEHTRGMDEYKDRRYSGLTGKARWVKDLFADLPDEVNRIYERARDNYLTAMREVINDVATTVERELTRAKDRIAKGRRELEQAVDNLPKDLKALGREATADFDGKFDELQDSVNDKGTELVDTLATRYTDAVKAVDAEIAAEKEKNKGLVSKAADAIGGVINTIKELGRLLMGVLRKAASAIGLILRDPIGFLGRLVTGVGSGLKSFMKNAGRHLQQGVLAWLLGSGVGAGLRLPTSFDVLGILVLLASLLGLSWGNIRARLARRVPPKVMTAAETGKDAIPIVVEAKKRGIAGLWSDLKGRVGDLKKDLVKKLVDYLLPTIVIAGITWIVSLFNPASAFIRACKMIIDIVRFIVTQARQIIEFVNAVLDAVIAIARGGGGAGALVERALARSVPVLIGALAAILGIGGIAGRVKQIFQQIARPVNRAIDWVITKISGLLKKLAAKLKPRKPGKPKKPRKLRQPGRPKRTRDKRPPTRRPAKPKDRKDEKGKDDRKVRVEHPKVEVPFALAGEAHMLTFTWSGSDVDITMASRYGMPLADKFQEVNWALAHLTAYIDSIQDEAVKKEFREKFTDRLKKIETDDVKAYKTLYKGVFPHRDLEPLPLARKLKREARRNVGRVRDRAKKLLKEIVKWAADTGIPDLSREAIEDTINEKGKAIWQARFDEIKATVDATLKKYRYKGQELQYVGSMSRGWRGPHKGLTRFNLKDFDVDLFVVDPEEFARVSTTGRWKDNRAIVDKDKIFPTDEDTPDLLDLSDRVRADLQSKFPDVDGIADTTIVLRKSAL